MSDLTTLPRRVRFGIYEVNLRAGELRKDGAKVKLQEQPFRVLAMLLEHPGEIVTREELQKALWSTDTFVDFEHGLNKAINKIRDALCRNPGAPRVSLYRANRRGGAGSPQNAASRGPTKTSHDRPRRRPACHRARLRRLLVHAPAAPAKGTAHRSNYDLWHGSQRQAALRINSAHSD